MNDDNILVGFAGLVVGIAIIICILAASNSLPTQITRDFQKQAVSRGYATWVIDTNIFTGSTPISKFEWNK